MVAFMILLLLGSSNILGFGVQELVFIQKTCGVVGYRPHVFSTTLSHLVATNSAALIMPFIALRGVCTVNSTLKVFSFQLVQDD